MQKRFKSQRVKLATSVLDKVTWSKNAFALELLSLSNIIPEDVEGRPKPEEVKAAASL